MGGFPGGGGFEVVVVVALDIFLLGGMRWRVEKGKQKEKSAFFFFFFFSSSGSEIRYLM